MSRMKKYLGVGMLLLGTACPPKKPATCDPSKESCTDSTNSGPSLPPPPKNWCDSISKDLSGFECLTLAGGVDIESFGPSRDQISESSLATCFGGKLPAEIPKKIQKAQLPSYSQDWSNQFQNNTGLDLQKVSTWLPNANIEGGKSTKVTVEIAFNELERILISDIAPAFRTKIARSTSKGTLGKLDSCRKRLCKPNYQTVVEALSGYPKITITTDGEFNVGTQIGWDAKKVDLGVNTDGSGSKKNKIVMERSKEAGPVVVAIRSMSLADSMSTDDLCGETAMALAGSEASTPTKTEPKPTKTDPKTKTEPKPAEKPPANNQDFETGLKASIKRILNGTGDDPKKLEISGKTYKIGDKITLDKREEAIIANEETLTSKDGKRSFQFGDSCTIDAQETVEIMGFNNTGLFPEVLVKYKGTGSAAYSCPFGTLFFRFL